MGAAYHSSAYQARPSLGSRVTSGALSLGILAGLIAALLWVTAPVFVDLGESGALTSFDVAPGPRAPTPAKARAVEPRPAERRAVTPPAATPPPPPPVLLSKLQLPGVIVVTRETFAGSDVGKIPAAKSGPGLEVADAGGGGAREAAGEGSGGEVLHNADWYRKPSRAEMNPFMPPRQQEGWGMIACRTAERFRVEDCRELGESQGSGIARGMRRAAWQFLVRPPTRNGEPMLGVWVRIRFDIVRGITD
jgi:protein TonB